jgi:CHASE2 domain-containing sensor protein
MKVGAYDLIMKHRFRAPPADPDIVIVDIDEAALAAMAPDYGRFPWPRSVMAEMLEGIGAQQPRAIVFDITFSDPDVFHADGDAFFREAIARTPNVFFPMIRLNPANDALSELKVSALASATRTPSADDNATLAAVVPFFFTGAPSVPLGTNNLYADADGITRSYHVFRDEHGFRVPSLPALVAKRLGAQMPDKTDVLMNFRGAPPSFARVPFHDVYLDLQRERRQRAPAEFAGKIVIIGSTAPSLFDVKPTPVAVLHPGVEILATALDNFRNGDYIVELPDWSYVAITIAALIALAWVFSVGVEARAVNYAFTALQSGFLAVSYLALNYTPVFVDLTAPFAFCLAFFSAAKMHGLLVTWRRAGHPLTAGHAEAPPDVVFMQAVMTDRKGRNIVRRLVSDSKSGFPAWPLFRSWPVLDTGFGNTVTSCWRADERNAPQVAAEVMAIVRDAEKRGAAGHVALQVASGPAVAGEEVMRAFGNALADGAIGVRAGVAKMHVHESESWRQWLEKVS